MSTYKLIVQYNENAFEKLIVCIFKYTSETESVKMGKMSVMYIDDKIESSMSLEARGKLSYEVREYLGKYAVNMCRELESANLDNDGKFSGIEIIEIEEEEYDDVIEG